nr:Uncharacterised protein [Klebsiella pneumoniae]
MLVRANLPEVCLKKVLQHDKTRFGGILFLLFQTNLLSLEKIVC